MKMDRAEFAGTGAALAFHVALIAALTLSLAHVKSTPEPPSMEVEFVEDVGLQSAAPTSIATPPPASQAPEIGEAPPDEPAPAPLPPATQPRVAPAPAPRPVQRAQPRPAPAKPAPRVSRIGDDFLKGIADSPSKSDAPARPAAPTYNATARASIGQAIIRQAQRCADRQPFLGEGANQVRLTVNLKFSRSGRLARPPSILGTRGDSGDIAKYGELLEDQVRRIFADCSPFRLPADLYDTPNGGWKDFTFTYRVD
jgi:outer membrane biosynthesis protein TonB